MNNNLYCPSACLEIGRLYHPLPIFLDQNLFLSAEILVDCKLRLNIYSEVFQLFPEHDKVISDNTMLQDRTVSTCLGF
jgi:hypothetical protein